MPTGAPVRDPLDNLTAAEKQRCREIILSTVGSEATPGIRLEFWNLLDRVGPMSEQDVAYLRDAMVGVATIYQRYFYEDALWALKSTQPFKSAQREDYEKRLLGLGVMTEWRVRENEELMKKIAAHQAINVRGETIVFTEDMIRTILGNLEIAGKRIDLLFTRP